MTKEQWLEQREYQTLTPFAFFEYYKEMGGKVKDFDEFVTKLYSKYLVDGLDHLTPNGKIVNMTKAEEKVRDYYEEKFKYG